jgi:hypothetical protein
MLRIFCKICGYKIGAGEPVNIYPDGYVHRFKTTCEAVKEDDAKFLVELGVAPTEGV